MHRAVFSDSNDLCYRGPQCHTTSFFVNMVSGDAMFA